MSSRSWRKSSSKLCLACILIRNLLVALSFSNVVAADCRYDSLCLLKCLPVYCNMHGTILEWATTWSQQKLADPSGIWHTSSNLKVGRKTMWLVFLDWNLVDRFELVLTCVSDWANLKPFFEINCKNLKSDYLSATVKKLEFWCIDPEILIENQATEFWKPDLK